MVGHAQVDGHNIFLDNARQGFSKIREHLFMPIRRSGGGGSRACLNDGS